MRQFIENVKASGFISKALARHGLTPDDAIVAPPVDPAVAPGVDVYFVVNDVGGPGCPANSNDSLSLSGSDQVPDGFRQAIEEYYRSLSKKSAQTTPQR